MSNQDPIDPPQLLVDDPGTLANADPNDLEDRRSSDNVSRPLLPTAEAFDLVRQGMTAPPNLNPCCFRQEVDCNCNVQIQPPVAPPPADLGYGRIPPEERRTIEEFVNDHKAAREAAIQGNPSTTAIPLSSPKPRSPTGHKDQGGNSRSVMLSDTPFEHQFTFGDHFSHPMPDISSNTNTDTLDSILGYTMTLKLLAPQQTRQSHLPLSHHHLNSSEPIRPWRNQQNFHTLT